MLQFNLKVHITESIENTCSANDNIIVQCRHLDRVSAYGETPTFAEKIVFYKIRNFLYHDEISIGAIEKCNQ